MHTQAHRVILASTLSACVFLVASFYLPFLTLIAAGQSHQISLLDCVLAIAQFDFVLLAFVVFVFIIFVPAIVTLLLLFLASSIQWCYKCRRLQGRALQGYYVLLPWSMADIFVVGCLVSLVKVLDLADVRIESGFYCYVLFVLFLLVAIYFTDKRQITEKLQLTNELNVYTNNTGGQATWALLMTACLLICASERFPDYGD